MKPIYKIFLTYLLLIVFLLGCGGAFGQIAVKHFNAEWNEENDVNWLDSLKNCKTKELSIDDSKTQKKYSIVVVPTIIIFNNGEEVKRFQADLSFKLVATREEVQEEIDNQLMSDF